MGECKLIQAKATIAEGRPLRGLRPLKCRANITEESYFVPPEARCHIFEVFWCLNKVAYFGRLILKKRCIMPRAKFFPGF